MIGLCCKNVEKATLQNHYCGKISYDEKSLLSVDGFDRILSVFITCGSCYTTGYR